MSRNQIWSKRAGIEAPLGSVCVSKAIRSFFLNFFVSYLWQGMVRWDAGPLGLLKQTSKKSLPSGQLEMGRDNLREEIVWPISKAEWYKDANPW